jgi:hypothetical protein
MLCSQCSTQNPDSSAFCAKCGAALKSSPGPFPAPAAPQPNIPETTLWTGRFSARAEALHFLLWLVWLGILAVLYATVLAETPRTIHLLLLGAALLPGLLLLLRTALEKLTTRYRLTNQRLFRSGAALPPPDELGSSSASTTSLDAGFRATSAERHNRDDPSGRCNRIPSSPSRARRSVRSEGEGPCAGARRGWATFLETL